MIQQENTPSLNDHPWIVLIHPEIPPNTGTIARLSAAFQCPLHLIEPLGFSLSEKHVRRAGLDYWPYVNLTVHPSWEVFRDLYQETKRFIFVETKIGESSYDFEYQKNDLLIFGGETKGIPQQILDNPPKKHGYVTIPMYHDYVRSINLSNSVSIVVHACQQKIYKKS